MTLNKLSWPSPSFSLKKSWSGKVRAMSLLISFSLGEVCFRYSTYSCLWGESCTPSNSCQARPRKWCGIPLLTSSCKIFFFVKYPNSFGHLRDYGSLYLSVSLKLKLPVLISFNRFLYWIFTFDSFSCPSNILHVWYSRNIHLLRIHCTKKYSFFMLLVHTF